MKRESTSLLVFLIGTLGFLQSAYCSQDQEFESIVKILAAKRPALERSLIIAKVRERRPQMNRDVARYTLLWNFPRKGVRPHTLHHGVSIKDWKSESPQTWKNVASLSDLEASMGNWKSCILHNGDYCSSIDRSNDGWTIESLFGEDKTWAIPTCSFSLSGMVDMQPYDIPIDSFLGFDGVNLRTCETSDTDADLINVVFDVNISEEQSPLNQACSGTLSMAFRKSQGLIVSQRLHNNSRQQGQELEFLFDNKNSLPVGFKSTYFDLEGGKPVASIIYDVDFIEICDHDIPDSGCYLGFFGLPEPPGVGTPNGQNWTVWVFVGLALLISAILLKKYKAD